MATRRISTPDGMEESHKGRSNRATGNDDYSVLGRGHGFGPETSGAGRGGARGDRAAESAPKTSKRNYGRLADEPGKEAGESLVNDAYTRGSMTKEGYGSRSRSMESSKKRKPGADSFDEDLKH